MAVTQHEVAADEGELRLDRWFKRHFPQVTQIAVQKFCRTGQVRVDGKRVEASTRLVPGQIIRVPPVNPAPPPEERPAVSPADQRDLEDMVIYRDEQILVINKPHGLPVQGGPGIYRHLDGMLDALRFDAKDRPRLVHRLDRDTSGVMLLARSASVASKLAALFRTRDVQKTYWAIVVGRPSPMEGLIDLPLKRIGSERGERTQAAERDDPDAARALTEYVVREAASRKLSWLELSPRTGRTHQLRVHCLAMGTPILGDGKYGEAASHLDGFSGKLHLHARALRLPHPAGGMLEVSAPLPSHMSETFKRLGFTPDADMPPARGFKTKL